jgi:hypothetical protein
MTEQQLKERLQKLWVQATAACGTATAQIIAEIREVEGLLDAIEASKAGPAD